ncbi:helix-turn-helix domain-containing protein [Nocardia sp. NEAU-G5]|uniref:Helix-turn-helix domain-containing protein n=1 Tax=Nocardia albiluteola TaxID=2842303 RepID=A0ABS6BAW1_9NOCA|nr:helix-turn-helix domain-containing protein [Nocardia albiluteola]MBU3067428.1 helix-turn-helix domain-containing protein [Nocardia albiluteola]
MRKRTVEPQTSAERTTLYRTLAHPLRGQILQYLSAHTEANSTTLAGVLGESTGTTSYHLRKLAESKLIEEIPEKSRGRERWWRTLPFSHTMPDPATMEPQEQAAAEQLAKLKISADIDRYVRANKEWTGPDGWAQVQRHATFMTHDELQAFMDDYMELLRKHGHLMRAEAPPDARPMAIRLFAVPDEDFTPSPPATPDRVP